MVDAEFADRAVFLPSADALVLADLHIGRDATSNVSLSLGERTDLTTRVSDLLDRFSPGEVVLAGDVLHAFDRLPEEAESTFADFRELVDEAGATLVVVRGNHDTLLDELADPRDEYRLADGTLVHHGHEEPDADAPRYVVGHDHPAIEIEGKRRPCYLWGEETYRGSDVLVLPAFTRFASGMVVNDLRGGDFQSPLVTRTNPLRPIVRDEDADETYRFPPLAEFRKLL
ncbi:metallophosphoesterase [Haladaptatus sp. R4]|uniref:metallophosphoesterase n=1 Tax=Haladaptatus sp. R4 TaxID=1679489 RepID=UPI0007B49F6F|nr:metallophosphoesterase [Haladaptatus sp. R4]KZN24183.1 metallophosphoesterase [Haladaptatus sp. R4]